MVMLKSIQIMLAIAAHLDYEIWQMDVKIAFLNEKLTEEVYMIQPEGFTFIYGLKQASRSWNIYFDKVIKMYGFIKNGEEPCIYKWANGPVVIFFVLYVDDILLIENDIPALQKIKVWLSSQFSMKDLGEASYILEMKIYRDRSKKMLGLSQFMYIDTVLKRFSMENSKKGLSTDRPRNFFL